MSSDPQARPEIDLQPRATESEPVAPASDQALEPSDDQMPIVAADVEEISNAGGASVSASSEPEDPSPHSLEPVPEAVELSNDIAELKAQKESLLAEITILTQEKQQLFASQTEDLQTQVQQFMAQSLAELKEKQQSLQKSVSQLERRRDRIREEMRTTFAGSSQEIAIRVQGFKDYLVGSLQDLVMAAEQLDVPSYESSWTQAKPPAPPAESQPQPVVAPQFSEQSFAVKAKRIQEILDRYRIAPDYYGPPWQLRRTFEPIHAERVKKWLFSQGGRGAIRSMGSRLQNILVASASISVLYSIYGDRLRALILANTPERLGEWRRGLQDCLGISRSDFGPNSGVILFENADALVQKADRLVEDDRLPLIIIDEAEDNINLSLLQYPLWLAFAPEPQSESTYLF